MLTGTPHFTLAEVQRRTQWPIPAEYHDNVQRTLEELETVRAALGVPLILNSLWRSAASNAALPGHAVKSQHLTGDAGDVSPVGITLEEAARRWQVALAAGRVPAFGQFIVEQAGDDGLGAHIHYGRGTKRESLVRLADGTYHWLTDWLASIGRAIEGAAGQLGGWSVAGVALAAGFRVVALVRGWRRWNTAAAVTL